MSNQGARRRCYRLERYEQPRERGLKGDLLEHVFFAFIA
jgi:hypothetical protein